MLNTFFRLMSCTRKRQVFTSWIAGRGVWKVLQIIWFLRKKWLNVKPLPIYNNWPMHYECWIKKKRSLLANILIFVIFVIYEVHYLKWMTFWLFIYSSFFFIIIYIIIILFETSLLVNEGKFSNWIRAAWFTSTHILFWLSRMVSITFIYHLVVTFLYFYKLCFGDPS